MSTSIAESKADTLRQFCKLIRQFLGELEGVFPECTSTAKAVLTFDIGITHAPTESIADKGRKKLMEAWQERLAPLYPRCAAKDEKVIQELSASHEIFKGMDLWGKWNDPGIDGATRECIWDYLNNLNRFCQMYYMCDAVPEGMRKSIESVASTLKAEMEAAGASAEGGLPALNPDLLMKIATSVQREMDPAQMQQLAQSIDPALIQSLCGGLFASKTT